MENEFKEYERRILETAQEIYEKLKSKSDTYGELNNKISVLIKEITWRTPELAMFLQKELIDLLHREFSSLHIK